MAQLKDLLVTGATRILGKVYSPEFVGKLTGNADTATKATGDSNGQNIVSTYIKNLSIDGKTLNIYKGNGSNSSLTIKDKIYAGNRITTVDDLNKFIEQGTFKYGIINPLEGLNGLEKNDGIVLSFSWDNSTAWGHQIFLDDSSYNMAHRHLNNGTWQAWVKMIDANNYTNYTVTKTGSGASGTWGISITGNSGTATKLQTARTISLTGSVTGSGSFDGSGNVTISTTTNHTHNQYYDSGISRAANTVLAAPNGSAGSATFRKLVAADLPNSYLPLSGGTMSGTINFAVNKLAMNFRNDAASYYTGIMYQTTGNEALVFAARNAVTSFMFKCGLDPTAMTSSTWTTTTPSVQIKGQSLYINSLIANGAAPSYNFYVNGTSYLTDRLIATANIYSNRGSTSAPSFMWNKAGTYFGGIGYHGVSGENYLGPVNGDGTWADSSGDTWYIRGRLKSEAIGSSDDTYIAFPSGGGYKTKTSVNTGYLKITLPQTWTNTMLSFRIKIYEYRTNTSCDYFISGYNYSSNSSWINVTAYSTGKNDTKTISNLNVRFGHDGSKCAIYIGESNTSWNYTQVRVCDVLTGFNNCEYSKWATGWEISFTTTLGTISQTVTNPNVSRINTVYDINDGDATTFAYSKTGLDYNAYTWLAAWNGKELRAVNKSQFATAGHTHNYAGSSSAGGPANSTNAIAIVANNEIRFIKPSAALGGNALYIGYAWADGTKSKMINEYRFCGGDGNLTQITATQFNGFLNGNASTASSATKLSTSRTISLAGTVVGSGSFDGSANLSISTSVKDVNNSNTVTFAYSKAGVGYDDITWLAAWNGYELRAINKNQFAKASTSGNATSADKLTTARNIALSGYSSGSANFNGSANITITDWGYGCVKYVTQDTATSPYIRIAYASTANSWYDASIMFAIDSGYAGGGYGIVKVVMRSNNISTKDNSYCEVKWLVRQGFSADQLFVNGNAPASGTQYADLYFKASGTYQAVNIRVLTAGGRGSQSRSWTFDNTAARAKPDIRAYTYTNNGYDSSTVSYSTSSGTATNATQLNSKTGSMSATANTYVLRDGNNYVHFNYIESNTKASENPTISQIIVTNGSDNYYRKASLAHLKSSLGSMPASDVYAWAKASTKPSYSWGEITGKPTTFTPSAHNHSLLVTAGDNRSSNTTPNSYANNLIFQGLKANTKIDSPSGDTYSYVVGLRGWKDSSGGYAHELAFNDSGIFARRGSTTSWNVGWQKIALNRSSVMFPGISLDDNGAYIYGESNSGNILFRFRPSSSADYSYTNVSYLYNNKLGAQNANGYWGMATPNGGSNDWIRTTSNGIIPYQSGGVGGGHGYLGTSSWYFSQAYIDTINAYNINATGYVQANGLINTFSEYQSQKGSRDWRFGSATGNGDQNWFGFYDYTYGFHGGWYGPTHSFRANGEIISTSANAFRAVYGNYGFIIRNDGANTYFMMTNSGDPYGTWNDNYTIFTPNGEWQVKKSQYDGGMPTSRGYVVISDSNADRVYSLSNYNASYLKIRGGLGSYHCTYSNSDIRLKMNVKDSEINALNTINRIKVRQFNWKKDGKHQKIGFIADELEEIDKKFSIGGGYEDKEGKIMDVKSVDTFYLMGYIVKAIQELSEQNLTLKQENDKILKEIELLKSKGESN